jgi:hypothetical protein
VDLTKRRCGLDSCCPVHGRRALVNTTINVWTPYKAENLFTTYLVSKEESFVELLNMNSTRKKISICTGPNSNSCV